jgi:hypothetical protein
MAIFIVPVSYRNPQEFIVHLVRPIRRSVRRRRRVTPVTIKTQTADPGAGAW